MRSAPNETSEFVMTLIQRTAIYRARALMVTALVSGNLLAGCASRSDLPYHVIHNPARDRPRGIFVDPVGKGYPALVQRTNQSSEPLPNIRRPVYGGPGPSTPPAEVPVPPAIKNPASLDAPNPAGPAKPKQTTLRPARDRAVRVDAVSSSSDPGQASIVTPLPPTAILSAPSTQTSVRMPKSEAVVTSDAIEARASTQLRR